MFENKPGPEPKAARNERARALLKQYSALDGVKGQEAEAARQRLRAEAESIGVAFESMIVTHEAIPDPNVEALPGPARERIGEISRGMHEDPAVFCAELEQLVQRYPHIPMLRNHLAAALDAAGRTEEAREVLAETRRLFPEYLFGFCNHVTSLLTRGDIDGARALVEGGPRGPLLGLTAYDPGRSVFHTSEAVAYAYMIGTYMLATDRPEAAVVQLQMLHEINPDSPQAIELETALILRGHGRLVHERVGDTAPSGHERSAPPRESRPPRKWKKRR